MLLWVSSCHSDNCALLSMMWKTIFCILLASFINLPCVTGQGLNPDLTILLTNWRPGRILRLSPDEADTSQLTTTQITSSLPRPVAIDYDQINKKIYYTDVTRNRIGRMGIDGTTPPETLLSLNFAATPDGIALDTNAQKLFYTDTGRSIIASMDMDGNLTTHKTHLTKSDGLENPRAIVLDTIRKKIFWTDWGDEPHIATTSYDGRSVFVMIKKNIVWPNGMAIDQKNKILFWCDAKLDRIESSYLDGSNRAVLVQEPSTHYFDIFYYDKTLYFTDWRRRAILTMSAAGGPVRMWNSTFITQPAGLHLVSDKDTDTACPKKTHGIYCQFKCGMCSGRACNNVTGRCPDGCQPGYHGFNCKLKCPPKTYGPCINCGHCHAGASCDQMSGYCLNGCQLGWQGYRCDTKCGANAYGPHCVRCGNCAGGSCEPSTGHCVGGCTKGWTGPLCKTNVASESKDNTGVIAGAVGGSMAFIFIVLIIVIAVVVFLTRRSKTANREAIQEQRNPQFFNVPMSLPPAYSSNVMSGASYNTTSDEATLVSQQGDVYGRPVDPSDLPPEEEKTPLP